MEFITVTTVIPNVIILTQNIIKQAIVKPGILFLLLFVCSTVQKFEVNKIFWKEQIMLLLSKDILHIDIYIDFYLKKCSFVVSIHHFSSVSVQKNIKNIKQHQDCTTRILE